MNCPNCSINMVAATKYIKEKKLFGDENEAVAFEEQLPGIKNKLWRLHDYPVAVYVVCSTKKEAFKIAKEVFPKHYREIEIHGYW